MEQMFSSQLLDRRRWIVALLKTQVPGTTKRHFFLTLQIFQITKNVLAVIQG